MLNTPTTGQRAVFPYGCSGRGCRYRRAQSGHRPQQAVIDVQRRDGATLARPAAQGLRASAQVLCSFACGQCCARFLRQRCDFVGHFGLQPGANCRGEASFPKCCVLRLRASVAFYRSARETPAFMPGRDSAAREACPFLSHPPFGWLSLHKSSIMCEWKSSERTSSGSIRRLSKK